MSKRKYDPSDYWFNYDYIDLPDDDPIDLKNLNWDEVLQFDCNHNWREYQGLFESYKYCDKCNVKKDKSDINDK